MGETMTDDTSYFNQAFMAYHHRTGYDGRFCDLPIVEQMVVLRDAQTLKDSDRIMREATQTWMHREPYETGECCMRDHANAVAPWTCQCECHKR